MSLFVDPKKTAQFLLKITLVLVFINIFGQIIGILLEPKSGSALLEYSQRQSVLRLFSTLLLVFCAALFFLIALKIKSGRSGGYYYWIGLSVIFFFLSIAKDTTFDEQLGAMLQTIFNISRSTVFMIAYAVALILIPVLYLNFFLHLPRHMKNWFIVGSITFLTGAFVLDLITAYIGKILDHRSIAYITSSSLEVFLESSGLIILIFTLLTYLSTELNVEKLEFLFRR